MGIAGHKPKTRSEKRITGNPGGRSMGTAFPPPKRGPLTCPPAVKNDARALAHWRKIVGGVAPEHLAQIDEWMLTRLCKAIARAEEAEETMERAGMVVKAPNTGLPIQSPWLPIVNRQTDIARKLAADLALTPSERSRVGKHEPIEDDSTAQYFDA
jgi:P27 family predicted phage terminase small subunit